MARDVGENFLLPTWKIDSSQNKKKYAKMAISCTWETERTWILQRFPTFFCWKSDWSPQVPTHAASNRPAASTTCNGGDSWNPQNKYLNLLNLLAWKLIKQVTSLPQSESTKLGMLDVHFKGLMQELRPKKLGICISFIWQSTTIGVEMDSNLPTFCSQLVQMTIIWWNQTPHRHFSWLMGGVPTVDCIWSIIIIPNKGYMYNSTT